MITSTIFFLFEVNVRHMSNKADYYLPSIRTHTHMHEISQATLFLCVFCFANMGVIICHLMFNFCWRLCSACLIWVLNKLPRPCSHFCLPPSLSCSPPLPAFPFLLIPSHLGGQHYSTSKTDSHWQQKKEAPISVQGWAALFTFDIAAGYSLLPSQSHGGICLLTDRESGLQWVFQGVMFLQQGSWYLAHKSYMAFLRSSFIKWLCKPAYTKTLNSMNLKSLSTFATVEDYSWMLNVGHGFSDTITLHRAHLFLMCFCWWHTE